MDGPLPKIEFTFVFLTKVKVMSRYVHKSLIVCIYDKVRLEFELKLPVGHSNYNSHRAVSMWYAVF